MDRVNIIYIPHGGKPFEMEIDCTLESFQSMVDGYFDYIMADVNNALIFNADLEHPLDGNTFVVGFPSGRKVWTDTTLSVADVNRILERREHDIIRN